MIKPTVGRVVWFNQENRDLAGDKTLAAIVAHVHSDRLVNLCVIDANGNTHSRTSVTLVQPGDATPGAGPYCEWMPYQIGQAARAAT